MERLRIQLTEVSPRFVSRFNHAVIVLARQSRANLYKCCKQTLHYRYDTVSNFQTIRSAEDVAGQTSDAAVAADGAAAAHLRLLRYQPGRARSGLRQPDAESQREQPAVDRVPLHAEGDADHRTPRRHVSEREGGLAGLCGESRKGLVGHEVMGGRVGRSLWGEQERVARP